MRGGSLDRPGFGPAAWADRILLSNGSPGPGGIELTRPGLLSSADSRGNTQGWKGALLYGAGPPCVDDGRLSKELGRVQWITSTMRLAVHAPSMTA